VTVDKINGQIASYMNTVTGRSWKVKCNAEGLCTAIRSSFAFDTQWLKGNRVQANRVTLSDGSKVLLVNVHYMN
jgi:hypothetical protein